LGERGARGGGRGVGGLSSTVCAADWAAGRAQGGQAAHMHTKSAVCPAQGRRTPCSPQKPKPWAHLAQGHALNLGIVLVLQLLHQGETSTGRSGLSESEVWTAWSQPVSGAGSE
jgi:hypothetical protein